MVVANKPAALPPAVVSDPSVMSGMPVVRGTRVPAETILAYLRAGLSHFEIYEDYPTLPVGGVEAVIAWAESQYGPEWKSAPATPGGH